MKELEYPFDSGYIRRKRKQIKRELQSCYDLKSFISVKIALLCGSTIGELKAILELFLLNQGIIPIFYEGHYNRYYEEIMFDNTELEAFEPDFIYLHTSVKNINEFPAQEENTDITMERLDHLYDKYERLWSKIKESYHCAIIQNNFEMLPYRLLGNADAVYSSGAIHYIEELNRRLAAYAADNSNFYINDLHYQSAYYGLERWFDMPSWYTYKYPFAPDAIPFVCHNLASIIKSVLGKNKKALVLDLDNTLWGGVAGDAGRENILLGPETPQGMAYSDFQGYIKSLSLRGIVLTIASKNDLETVAEGLGHPFSKLRKEDFLAIKAGWGEKDDSIEGIAKELNILPESMVFIDDNPAERDFIKKRIMNIAVLPIDEPENYIKSLDQSGYFEMTGLSIEDRNRSSYYKNDQRRTAFKSRFETYEDFLSSLHMVAHIENIQRHNIERAVQLINKTNQFNLTTARMTEADMLQLSEKDTIILCGSLKDKFGDNGLVTVMTAECIAEIAWINIWVMSCRVFKRELELAMFDRMISICREKGIKQIRGIYKQSSKNSFVADLYSKLGFIMLKENGLESCWYLDIPENYQNKNRWIEII